MFSLLTEFWSKVRSSRGGGAIPYLRSWASHSDRDQGDSLVFAKRNEHRGMADQFREVSQ